MSKSNKKIITLLILTITIMSIIFLSGCTEETDNNVPTDKWLFAMDTDNVRSKYQQDSWPRLIIIDSEGKITYKGIGYHDKDSLIEKILQAKNGNAESLGDSVDFTVTTFNNQIFTLSEKKGKVVVIDLTGVNCYWCDKQMPELQEIQKEYGNDIILISIDTNFSGETEQDVIDTYNKYMLR